MDGKRILEAAEKCANGTCEIGCGRTCPIAWWIDEDGSESMQYTAGQMLKLRDYILQEVREWAKENEYGDSLAFGCVSIDALFEKLDSLGGHGLDTQPTIAPRMAKIKDTGLFKYCTECVATLNGNENYCSKCGAKLEVE